TTAYYVVKAVDEEGNPLADQPTGTVNVSFTDGTATAGDDYTFNNTTVTVGSAFSAESVDDALTDSGENFVVSLDSGSFSDADTYEKVEYAPDTVTTTILDEAD
ncbi:Calx-beta domain-containing protein, partial [Hyunsoonleella pacifica]